MLRRSTFLAGAAWPLVVAATAAAATTSPRVAIVVAPEGVDVTQVDVERFVAQLGHGILRHPRYQLVTRARLDAVLQEQGLSNSAYADPASAAKLGRIVGASHLLHVTVNIDVEQSKGLLDHESVDVSSDYELIAVDTARIIANGSADGTDERRAPGGGQFTTSALSTRRAAIDACADDVISQAFPG